MIASIKASKTAQPATDWNEKIQENKKHFYLFLSRYFQSLNILYKILLKSSKYFCII